MIVPSEGLNLETSQTGVVRGKLKVKAPLMPARGSGKVQCEVSGKN